MLFKAHDLDGIADGRVTLAFRRWRRATVKAGGGLNTRVGRLAIETVEVVDVEAITEADAQRAGHGSLVELKAALAGEAPVHRIASISPAPTRGSRSGRTPPIWPRRRRRLRAWAPGRKRR